MLSILFHSDGVRFIFYTTLVWGLASPFLYGLIGPQWWRNEAKEYWKYVFLPQATDAPATLVKTVIMFIEMSIPLAVAWWLFIH